MTLAPPRLLTWDQRKAKAREAGLLALVFVGAWFANPNRPLPFEVCAFKYLTGFDCPTCGLTRALCHAVHFDLAQSVSYHPAGPLVAIALVVWLASGVAAALRS